MTRPPFQMRASRGAALRRDGKHIVSGRASYVWERFLYARVAGVPGDYEIRMAEPGGSGPWHKLDWSIGQAEYALSEWGTFGSRRVALMKRTRLARKNRGLPVG
jgi:hypothetical protein